MYRITYSRRAMKDIPKLKSAGLDGKGELPPLIEVAASYFSEDCAPTDVDG
ncbi:MAG: hypothetical protein IJQ24_06335 [Synergistaceae bacterium]|nr:hypothetical protein [Synergistaceae bacterium]